jgi:hypothetical protein
MDRPAHPSPARQLLLPLEGSWEVSAGGETRVFSVGDALLTEDTSGAGHAITALEDSAAGTSPRELWSSSSMSRPPVLIEAWNG